MPDSVEKFLEHHGVLGMHWGRHLPGRGVDPGKNAAKKAPFKPGTHPDHSTAHTLKKKPVHQLSNPNIKTVNERLQLEKQLSSLKSTQSRIGKGQAFISTGLGVAGTGLAVYKLYNNKNARQLVSNGATWLKNVNNLRKFTKFLRVGASVIK